MAPITTVQLAVGALAIVNVRGRESHGGKESAGGKGKGHFLCEPFGSNASPNLQTEKSKTAIASRNR